MPELVIVSGPPVGGWPAFTAEAVPDGVNMPLEDWAALSDMQRELVGKRCLGVPHGVA